MAEKLIQRWLKDGDEQAAEALYKAHHERIYRLAYGLLHDAGDAEEVMQDTLVYALTRIGQFDPQRASFSTWLHTIAVSRCRDRQRRKRLPKVALGGRDAAEEVLVEKSSGPEDVAVARESEHELWQALDQLSPKLREAIVLRYWGGHTYQEMAEILRCPLPTAQSRVRLAYEQLRKLLSPAAVPVLDGETLR